MTKLILIKKREDAGIKHLNDPNTFIEYLNIVENIYNVNYYIPNRNRKNWIVFDDVVGDIMTNKNFQAIIKELFIRCRKLIISLIFITPFCFSVHKKVRLNSTHYLIMKIHNKKELQSIAINHLANINYESFMKIYGKFTCVPYSFFTIDATLTPANALRFRKNILNSL